MVDEALVGRLAEGMDPSGVFAAIERLPGDPAALRARLETCAVRARARGQMAERLAAGAGAQPHFAALRP